METRSQHPQIRNDPVRILVIDNDPKSIDAIQLTFELGWPEAQILKAETGREGIDLVELEYPTAIVLGLGLTDASGFEVLRQIRRFSGLPILVLLPDNSYKNTLKTLERDKHIVGQCPKCASILVYQEGSFTCPICGFSKS